MLNYSHLLHPYIKCCHTLSLCVAALSLLFAGCSDDTFDDFYRNNGDLTFEVSAPGSWMEIKSRSGEGCPDNVKITRMESSDNQQLFLIAEERNSTDSVVKMTRGALVETVDAVTSIGISAITYNSTEQIASRPPLFWDSTLSKEDDRTWSVEGSQLKWDNISESNVCFYAYAPHSDHSENAISLGRSTDGTPVITYTVPTDDVAGQYDLLAYAGSYDPGVRGTVNIAFKHILTAVTISTGTNMLAGKITKVTLSGIKGSAAYDFATDSWTDDGKNFIYSVAPVTEDNTSPNQEIIGADGNLTFLMIPQTLGYDAKLTIEFTDAYGGARTLTASLTGNEWTAGKKVNYTVSTTGIKIVPIISVEGINSVPTSGFIPNVTVKTSAKKYKYIEGSGETAVETVPVPLTFEVGYSLNDGANVFPADDKTDDKWAWEQVSELKDDAGNVTGYKGNIMLDPRNVFTEMKAGFTKTEVGSSTDYSDLTGGGETANCYLIDAPGYYSFPTIYGNARGKNGTANPDAYTCNVNENNIPQKIKDNNYVLMKFKKHDGDVIESKSIDIAGVNSATLIWQDSPDLISDVSYENNMVKFRVRPETLNQGNALIAVNNSDKTILWSWHIWVTPYKDDFNNSTVIVNSSNNTDKYAFTKYNLGYCDSHIADESERIFKLVFRVTNPLTNETIDVTPTYVTPECGPLFSQEKIYESVAGDNTYYQWGRKDPMPGGIWNEKTLKDGEASSKSDQYDMQNKPIYPSSKFEENYSNGVNLGKSFGKGESGVTISETIKNPNVFFMHDDEKGDRGTWDDYYRRHWHKGPSEEGSVGDDTSHAIMNYWDSQLYELGEKNGLGGSNGQFPTKTVYDPCPVGFCVPPINAFSDISIDNEHIIIMTDSKGRKIGWEVKFLNGGVLTFPSTGLRDMGDKGSIKRPASLTDKTNAAHSKLTFIASCSFCEDPVQNPVDNAYYKTAGVCLIAYFDNRSGKKHVKNSASQNSYGLTVRPIHDTKITVTTE